MSSFKQLSRSDVTVVANQANKQWTLPYCPYPTSSEYLTIYKGTNVTGAFSADNDPVTEGEYERLVYTQINQMFYQTYTASLNTSSLMFTLNNYESASQQRPTSSYFIYNNNDNLIVSFPTGAMEGIRVVAINQSIFGNKVLPGNFQLSSSAYNIKDDAYGNLFDYSGSKTYVGNIYYAQGLAIITNQDYQLMFPLPPLAKNDSGSFLTTDSPKTISASFNDDGRSGTILTGSILLSGSASDLAYWSTGSNGTIILTTTTAGTYTIYYTIGAQVTGSCPTTLRSNKAKVVATVTEPTTTTTTTTSTTTTTTTLLPTTTTSTTTTTTTSPVTTTTTTTTSTTTTTTTVSSDCALTGSISVPAPLPVFGLTWTTENSSYAQCPGSEWVITNNNQSIRYNISDSSNCGGTCDQTQSGSAEAIITVGSSSVSMSLDFTGLVEQQDAGFENIIFKLNGTEVARATSVDLNLGCVMGPVSKSFTTSPPYLLTSGSVYTLRIDFTTGDSSYHTGSYYEVDLGFTPI